LSAPCSRQTITPAPHHSVFRGASDNDPAQGLYTLKSGPWCDYRATKSQTLRLSSCTLRLRRVKTNTASAPLFPFHDPHSQTQFQNDEIVPYLVSSEHFDSSYAFASQDTLLKLNYYTKNVVISRVGLVCIRDKVAAIKSHV